ncbi:MAG: hypothetical protein ACR2PM_01850 [Hyphomicrobiales bacterium]
MGRRALFAVDFIPVKAVAYRTLPDAHLPEWIGSLRRIERVNFEILVPGHGAVGARADVTAFRRYMSDLHDEVLKYARQGKTLEETKKLVDLSAHKDLAMFDKWMPLNVEGAYQRIQMHRRPDP